MNPWNLAEDRVYTCPRVRVLLNARGALQSAEDGQTNIMQLMLDIEPETARPWLEMKDDDGRTALNLGSRDGHVAVVNFIVMKAMESDHPHDMEDNIAKKNIATYF